MASTGRGQHGRLPHPDPALDFGADIVVASLTKFMGGHGTTLGGVIVDGGRFDWAKHQNRFPQFSTPDVSYHGMVYTDRYGAGAYLAVPAASISAPPAPCCRR